CVSGHGLPLMYAVFFFSSRRRHTRFSRDWSSDVCFPIFPYFVADVREKLAEKREPHGLDTCQRGFYGYYDGSNDYYKAGMVMGRSEERRVGKECGRRWVWGYSQEESAAWRCRSW